METLFLQINLV